MIVFQGGSLTYHSKFVLAIGRRPHSLPPHEGLSRGLLEYSLDMAAGFPHSKWIEERERQRGKERDGERNTGFL